MPLQILAELLNEKTEGGEVTGPNLLVDSSLGSPAGISLLFNTKLYMLHHLAQLFPNIFFASHWVNVYRIGQ